MSRVSIKQAVILAGGKGERLKPLTDTMPKSMVPLGGKPFLGYLVELLKYNNIKEIVMLVGYMHEKIIEYFGDGSRFGVNIKYSIGSVEDDTGTRVRNAKNLLEDHFLLMYGDVYWPLRLKELTEFYAQKNVLAAQVVYNNTDGAGEYGFENNMYVDQDDFNCFYDPSRKDQRLNTTNIGFYLLSKKVFDFMPEGDFHYDNVVTAKLAESHQLAALRTDIPSHTITDINFLAKAEKVIEKVHSNFV